MPTSSLDVVIVDVEFGIRVCCARCCESYRDELGTERVVENGGVECSIVVAETTLGFRNGMHRLKRVITHKGSLITSHASVERCEKSDPTVK